MNDAGTLRDAKKRAEAQRMEAMRGVRHGNVHIVPLAGAIHERHAHGAAPHVHLKPVN